MLGDNYELYKVLPYLHNVRTIRDRPQLSQGATESDYNKAFANTPIGMEFTVRYYFCLKPKGITVTKENESEYTQNQRYAEFTWASAWLPKPNNVLTFEMSEEWNVANIDVTAMKSPENDDTSDIETDTNTNTETDDNQTQNDETTDNKTENSSEKDKSDQK